MFKNTNSYVNLSNFSHQFLHHAFSRNSIGLSSYANDERLTKFPSSEQNCTVEILLFIINHLCRKCWDRRKTLRSLTRDSHYYYDYAAMNKTKKKNYVHKLPSDEFGYIESIRVQLLPTAFHYYQYRDLNYIRRTKWTVAVCANRSRPSIAPINVCS